MKTKFKCTYTGSTDTYNILPLLDRFLGYLHMVSAGIGQDVDLVLIKI